jgi:hypothetical protein
MQVFMNHFWIAPILISASSRVLPSVKGSSSKSQNDGDYGPCSHFALDTNLQLH